MTAMITARMSRISPADGSLNARVRAWPQREEHHDQQNVHDGAGEGVHADRGDDWPGRWAGFCRTGVQRHPADVGGRDPVDERGGALVSTAGPNGTRPGTEPISAIALAT